jgi:S1-C subfamily serine protease
MPSKIPAIIGGQQVLNGGDIILAIEGIEITPDVMGDVRRESPDIKPGSIIKLRIRRAGKVIKLSALF